MSGTVNNSSSPNQQYSVVLLSDKDPSLLEVLHTFFAAAWRRRHVIVVPLLVLPVL